MFFFLHKTTKDHRIQLFLDKMVSHLGLRTDEDSAFSSYHSAFSQPHIILLFISTRSKFVGAQL